MYSGIVYSVGSEPSLGYVVFVVNVAIIETLFGSTVGVEEIGVFHGLVLVYGAGQLLEFVVVG